MRTVVSFVAAAQAALAITIAEINGDHFLSSYSGKAVSNVTGLVTAASKTGFYLRSTTPDSNPATSESVFVYSSSVAKTVKVGDLIMLDGRVDEYRSSKDYIYLTELSSPTNVVVISSGHKVKPLVIGKDTDYPPTNTYTSLDQGGIFGVPNNVSRVSVANPQLQPDKYGLDFWESLVGELVTVKSAYSVSRPNNFGDTWVRGKKWPATGLNAHGGITMLPGGDANPETIIIGTPLDGTANANNTKMGDYMGDITGVVSQAFGYYRILPLIKLAVQKSASPDFPAVSFKSKGSCRGVTVADYNAENLMPNSTHLPLVVDQIINKLLQPDLIFLQEVQDSSGDTDDGVVSANKTFAALIDGLRNASGVEYQYAEVDPVNDKDGGEPGGNIRQAFLFRTDAVALVDPNQGGSLDANEVLDGPALKYNPGRIDPSNAAWDDSRKPLVAMWKSLKGRGKPFFTINVHFTSKGGSTTLGSDERPPINKGVDKRQTQADITADFVNQILDKDPDAAIIVAGDFNEYVQVAPLSSFLANTGLIDLEEAVHLPLAERYTYLFDTNSEALDHMFVSSPIAKASPRYQHLHLNTWQDNFSQVSDHDPSVARLNLCG